MIKKVVADNRKARFQYEILEKLEAGLMLQGSEVKALRDGRANLTDGYASFKDGKAMLRSVHISPYSHGGYANHEPRRARPLLLHKREILRLAGKVATQGLTVVPLKLYFNERGIAKVQLGLARGKKLHDKRETLKRKAMDREAQQAVKNRNLG